MEIYNKKNNNKCFRTLENSSLKFISELILIFCNKNSAQIFCNKKKGLVLNKLDHWKKF